jgi:hypothetical protein
MARANFDGQPNNLFERNDDTTVQQNFQLSSQVNFSSASDILRSESDRKWRETQSILPAVAFQLVDATRIPDNLARNAAPLPDLFGEQLEHDQQEQLWTIASNPAISHAYRQITEMLSSSDSQAAGSTLLSMLASINPEACRDGQLLLNMLNNPPQHETARNILAASGPFNVQPHQLLSVLHQPRHREAAVELVKLVNSGNSPQMQSAYNLAKLLSTDDQVAQELAQSLLRMLNDGNQRETAITMLNGLRDSKQMQVLLNMLNNGDQRDSANELLSMLRTPESADHARAVLYLASSSNSRNQSDSRHLLAMLNSPNQSDRQAAKEILSATNDLEFRHQLLTLWNNPDTRTTAQQLLDWRQSSDRAQANTATEFLNLLSSPAPEDQSLASGLVQLMKGGEQNHTAVQSVLTKLDNDRHKQLLVAWLNSGTNKEGAQAVANMLQGNAHQRMAANHLLEIADSSPENQELSNRLLAMLGNQNSRPDAVILLSRLSETTQIGKMLELLATPESNGAAKEVLKMLSSNDSRDQAAAARLLELLTPARRREVTFDGSAGPVQEQRQERNAERVGPTAGAELLRMLGNNDQREVAKSILAFVPEEKSAATILEALRNPQLAEATREIVGMLNNIDNRQAALDILSAASSPAALPGLLEISKSSEFKRGAEQLRQIQTSSGSVSQLLRLLSSQDRSTRAAGTNLLSMLQTLHDQSGDQTHNATLASNILSLPLTSEQTAALHETITNRHTASAGVQLLNLLRSQSDAGSSGASTVLSMLTSQDESERHAAASMIDLLGSSDPETAQQALSMLNGLSDRDQLRRVMTALSDQTERAGALQLLKLLDSPPDDGRQNAGNKILDLLTSEDEPDRQTGQRLLRMLGNPEQRQLAQNLVQTVPEPLSIAEFLRRMDMPRSSAADEAISRELLQMMSSPARQSQLAARNLLLLSAQQDQDLIGKMLVNPAERGNASTMLQQLSSPRECSALLRALNDQNTGAGAQAVLAMLKSGDSNQIATARSIMSLLPPDNLTDGADYATLPLAALGSPDIRQLASESFLLARTPQAASIVRGLLTAPGGRAYLEQLLHIARDPQQPQAATNIIERCDTTDQVRAIFDLLNTQSSRHQGELLISMLGDSDSTDSQAATGILRLLSSTDQQIGKTGKELLSMLADPQQRELAQRALLSIKTPELISQLLRIALDSRNQHAIEIITNLLKPSNNDDLDALLISFNNRNAVNALLASLASQRTAERQEGERILQLLNQPEHAQTAIRLLQQLSKAPPRTK